jgi:hypothetical protein
MNFRQPPFSQGGRHRILRMFFLLLIQHALTPSSIDAHARSRLPAKLGGNPSTDTESLPYLKITGALPLRFGAAPPPPDLTSKPVASVSPQPATVMPAVTAVPASVYPIARPESRPNDSATAQPAPVITNPPSTILPDDTRPSTRPEDFLPFFQFPGGTGDVTIVVPAAAAHQIGRASCRERVSNFV